MAFNAGAVYGQAILDDSKWKKGAKSVGQTNAKLEKSLKAVKSGFMIVGAAVVAGLTASIVKANQFNKAFANVTTLVDTAVVNTKQMRAELLGLDSRLGSAKDLTEGLYQALSAGVDAASAVQFVGEAAKFAKAGLTDTNTAVDVLTTTLNAYGLEANQTARVSDVFFNTIKKGKITGQQLASTLGTVIPVAATLGVNVEELGAAMVVMTKQGLKADQATTMLNAVFTGIIKPSTDMAEAIEKLGFASGSAMVETLGLQGSMDALKEVTGGNIEKTAGLFNNVRALKGVLALTSDGASEYKEILDEMYESSGATTGAFEKQELTFETFKNQVEKIAIGIGDKLLPSVYSFTNALVRLSTTKASEELEDEQVQLNILVGRLIEVNDKEEDRLKVIKEIDAKYPSFLKNLDTEKISITGIKDRLKEVNKQYINRIILMKQEETVNKQRNKVASKTQDLAKREMALRKSLAQAGVDLAISNDLVGKSYKDPVEKYKAQAIIISKALQKNREHATKSGITYSRLYDEIRFLQRAKHSLGKQTNKLTSIQEEQKEMMDLLGISTDKTKEKTNNFNKTINKTTNEVLAKNIVKSKEEIKNQKKKHAELLIDFKNYNKNDKQLAIEAIKEKQKEYVKAGVDTVAAQKWANEEIKKEMKKGTKATFDKMVQIINSALGAIKSTMDSIAGIVGMSFENQLAELKAHGDKEVEEIESQRETKIENLLTEYEEDKAILDEQRETGLISQEEYDEKVGELEQRKTDQTTLINEQSDLKREKQKKKQLKKENAIKKKQFETDKAFAIAQVWIQFATAAIGFLAAYASIPFAGPIISAVLIAAALGTAIAQTVLISQQKFVPSAATGGEITSEGLIRTDEAGGEIKKYNKGDIIIPNDISRRIAEGTGRSTNINVSFAGAKIANDMDLNRVANFVIGKLNRELKLAEI